MDFLTWAASAWDTLSGSAQVAAKAWGEISDPALWRSLAWIILGAVFLIMGISLWLRLPQAAIRGAAGLAKAAI